MPISSAANFKLRHHQRLAPQTALRQVVFGLACLRHFGCCRGAPPGGKWVLRRRIRKDTIGRKRCVSTGFCWMSG